MGGVLTLSVVDIWINFEVVSWKKLVQSAENKNDSFQREDNYWWVQEVEEEERWQRHQGTKK